MNEGSDCIHWINLLVQTTINLVEKNCNLRREHIGNSSKKVFLFYFSNLMIFISQFILIDKIMYTE